MDNLQTHWNCGSTHFSNQHIRDIRHLLSFLFLSFVLFFYIYSVSFPGLPSRVLSRRLAAIVFFVFAIIKNGGVYKHHTTTAVKEYSWFIKLHLALLLVSGITIVWIGAGEGKSIISSYLETVVFGTIAFYGIVHSFDSNEDFMKSVLLVSTIQCGVIISGTLSATFLSALIRFADSQIWDLEHMASYGYAIGFGCMTSTGVFKLSLGLVATDYCIAKNKNNIGLNILLFLLISVTMIAVARTGFVLIILALLALVAIILKANPVKSLKILAAILIAFGIILLLLLSTEIETYFTTIFKRLLITVEDNSWGEFFDLYIGSETTIIPRIGFWGELIISGTSGLGNQINVDGGFIKVFFAMGIPLAVFFYIFVSYLSLSIKRREYSFDSCVILFLFFAILMMGEFKEFFIEDVYFFAILMCYKHFLDKERTTI